MTVCACALQVEPSLERTRLVQELRQRETPLFVLDTCQRLEVFSLEAVGRDALPVSDHWTQRDAFERLARIAAGLESRIVGELEVLGQVRSAYKDFRDRAGGDHRDLDRFFQDALSLARRARRESGIDREMTSLSGLAARELLDRTPPGTPLAVVGTGSLAASVARYLGKRGTSPIRICGRCPENALELAARVKGFGSGLEDLAHLLDGVTGMVTATAAPHPVIYSQHLAGAASSLLIIDLGVPPDCCEQVRATADLDYVPLEAIERRAEGNTRERAQRADVAAAIIREGARAWSLVH